MRRKRGKSAATLRPIPIFILFVAAMFLYCGNLLWQSGLTLFAPVLKQPLRGTFSMPSQELQGLAVELVPMEILELAICA